MRLGAGLAIFVTSAFENKCLLFLKNMKLKGEGGRGMTHKIEISGVSKWFRRNGEEIAMRETSLAIEEGRFVSIIGPSGAASQRCLTLLPV